MSIVRNPVVRVTLFSLGFISLALGILGAFLPVLPTTPFLLLSAWCFLKSSPKAHHWLYQHPMLGKPLRDWEKNKSIARSTKVVALSMIALSLTVMWIKPSLVLWLKISVTVLLVCVSIFIVTRKSSGANR